MTKSYRRIVDPMAYVKMGGAIATDRITVDGAPVGFMRRDDPRAPEDSGWSFYAGDETKRYLKDTSNASVWHVNDIANFDPTIVPWLYALPGAAFARDRETGRFVEAVESRPDASKAGLPAGCSVVQGKVDVADRWTVTLETPFRRRVEDGSLVLWRPGLTLWISVGTAAAPPEVPSNARDVVDDEVNGVRRVIFSRASEKSGGPAVCVGSIDAGSSRVFVHAYYDREGDEPAARALLERFAR